MTKFAAKELYQIKITLVDSSPPIWRRLVVPKTIPLDKLHILIQLAMGWTNSHLYCFTKGALQYGMVFDDDFDLNMQSSEGIALNTLLSKEKDKILYEYDFGDSWQHIVALEKASLPETNWDQLPICIKGTGTCPTEDSGGIWGYYQKLQYIEDINNPEREELYEWLMADIEERVYDRAAINARIAHFYS